MAVEIDPKAPATDVPIGSDFPPLVPPVPQPVVYKPAAEVGERYDQLANQDRRVVAVFLLVSASLSFSTVLALCLLLVTGFAPENLAFVVASLIIVTGFLVTCASRSLIPYQHLPYNRRREEPKDPAQDTLTRFLEAAATIKDWTGK